MADLWVNNEVQHGAEKTLTTQEGRRAELLRIMWLAHAKKKHVVHCVFPQGFQEWATHPERWTQHEVDTLTVANPYDADDTIASVPSAADLRTMLDAVLAGRSVVFVAGGLGDLAARVAEDYSMNAREKFSEVLAICPLESLQGFVYSMQDVPDDAAPAYRKEMLAKGEAVLNDVRKNLPELEERPMVITEYAPSSLDAATQHSFVFEPPHAQHIYDLMQSLGKSVDDVKVPHWNPSFEAQLRLISEA
eukprot:TRINITY_DN41610_c0_g1_i2.p1 TRINITY_DN41610_c0_g1~~TRINITY_DN41610_c0_g1_i2.p1  ORF type:complete len:248 (+),score=37.71 TRINITY_DN41610_c0_g1_i2:182-925(+)